MSEIEKGLRLHKIAKELNIGTATITDFLGKKGFKIENKPTTKISDDMYSLLLKEYQGDKTIKEEANQISIGKIRREDVVIEEAPRPVRTPIFREDESEEILIKNVSSFKSNLEMPPAKEEPLPKAINLSANIAADPVTNSPLSPIKAENPPIIQEPSLASDPNTETKKIEEIPSNEAILPIDSHESTQKRDTKEIPAAPTEKMKSEELPQIKIVGKIDLSSFNKPKGDKITKKPEIKSNTVAPVQNQNPVKDTPPIEPNLDPLVPTLDIIPQTENLETSLEVNQANTDQIPAVVPETLPDIEPIIEEKALDPVRITTNFQKLSGPSIIGKIELPADKKNQRVASSNAALEQAKKKRKRKDSPPNQSSGHGSGQGLGQGSGLSTGPGSGHGTGQGSGQSFGQNSGQQRTSLNPANRRPDGGVRQDVGRPLNPSLKKDDRPKVGREEPTDKEIQDQIKATLARLSGAGKSGKFAQRAKMRRQKRDDVASAEEEAQIEKDLESKILKVTEFVTANELAKLMDVPVNQIISTCMSLGLFVSINQRLDAETLTIVADEFGYKVEFVNVDTEVLVEQEEDSPESLVERAPIVTVMGHVDHGKTSLLDYIRDTNVLGGEAGGITQHIGAYEVKLDNGKKITFLDTPGHEAFTAMRARGAQSTDIVIIVIAADDAVMPQTIEAINHAQAAGVPMIFAFNKMDKDGANPDKIREQLAGMNILVEEWGGKFQTQEISAKKGLNVDVLLEKVLLEAEMLDLKANPDKRAVGSVIEAALDKGRGIVTTVLVQSGTLRVGDAILAGCYSGKVKALFNERQHKVLEAGPATPVLVLGMQGSPQAGDKFLVMESEVEARDIANKRLQLQREQGIRTQKHITLDEIGRRLAIGNFKELNIIVKGDVDGSIEALSDSLLKLSTPEIQVNILHKSVGQISESDVLLATASDAIIIGFQVRPSAGARKLAELEQIDIRLYSIIYDAINEIKSAMEGMLSPVFEEKIVCNIEVRETFKISKVGTIAGCYVLDGKITRNTRVRVIRDGVVTHTGELGSLKRFKDDVKEVASGYECGLNLKNFNDLEVGDIIEGFEQVEVKRKL